MKDLRFCIWDEGLEYGMWKELGFTWNVEYGMRELGIGMWHVR